VALAVKFEYRTRIYTRFMRSAARLAKTKAVQVARVQSRRARVSRHIMYASVETHIGGARVDIFDHYEITVS
jgi:hypothetical protein